VIYLHYACFIINCNYFLLLVALLCILQHYSVSKNIACCAKCSYLLLNCRSLHHHLELGKVNLCLHGIQYQLQKVH